MRVVGWPKGCLRRGGTDDLSDTCQVRAFGKGRFWSAVESRAAVLVQAIVLPGQYVLVLTEADEDPYAWMYEYPATQLPICPAVRWWPTRVALGWEMQQIAWASFGSLDRESVDDRCRT